jgi:hypothetical protein
LLSWEISCDVPLGSTKCLLLYLLLIVWAHNLYIVWKQSSPKKSTILVFSSLVLRFIFFYLSGSGPNKASSVANMLLQIRKKHLQHFLSFFLSFFLSIIKYLNKISKDLLSEKVFQSLEHLSLRAISTTITLFSKP